jgi:hypothetical protein
MRRYLAGVLFLVSLVSCNLAVQEAATPAPTPDMPRVEFLYPSSGSSVIEGTDMTIDLIAHDETAGITRIELLLNGLRLREAPTESGVPLPVFRAEMNWMAQGVGLHIMTAIAYRADGTASHEADITLEVLARNGGE